MKKSEIKKIIAIISLAAVVLLCFSACAEKYAKDVDGVYVGETFEIYPPQEWRYNTAKKNQVIFCTADYPTDSASYISVGYTNEPQLEAIRQYKNDVMDEIIASLESQLGTDSKASIEIFEDCTVNGYDCVHVKTSYLNNGTAFTQDQYTFDSSAGSVTVCFTQDSGIDYSAEFKTALDSIVIK